MRSQWKAKSALPRQCEKCSATLERRRNDAGRLEGFRDFMRRRFCSLSCANSRNKGGMTRSAHLFHARKLLKPTCEACEQTDNRQAHHINGKWSDNRPENVQTLCLYCHHFWHATHRRLGLKPSRPMPRLGVPSSKTLAGESLGSEGTAMQSLRKSPKPSSRRTSTLKG